MADTHKRLAKSFYSKTPLLKTDANRFKVRSAEMKFQRRYRMISNDNTFKKGF